MDLSGLQASRLVAIVLALGFLYFLLIDMDGGSRSSTPEAPPQDLWSSILDSVSSTRLTPSKQILVLGQPSSGKSTLVSSLLQKPPSDAGKDDPRTDFALGYDWADVRDDADEGEWPSPPLPAIIVS